MNSKLISLVAAARSIALVSPQVRSNLLLDFANLITEKSDFILEENQRDLKAVSAELSTPLVARLKLDKNKLSQLVQGILAIAKSTDPIGQVLEQTILDDGLVLDKVRVPLGVVGVIFESRPDVLPQLIALAIRSGNALALKGGREAKYSNEAFLSCLQIALERHLEIPCDFIALFHEREIVDEMLKATEIFSLIIPRGSYEMVKSIMERSLVPVLGHAEGVCHIYIDKDADLKKAVELSLDSKIQYPAACNAVETLLINRVVARQFLADFSQVALENNVKLKGSEEVIGYLPDAEAVSDQDWSREYSDLVLNLKIVGSVSEAVTHINRYGSHHTDAIISENQEIVEDFLSSVDSACVFANCSTRFCDGFRFGLGAELGIGTGKIHARGPVGIEGLLTYKYKLRGSGQLVKSYVGQKAKEFRHSRVGTQLK